MEIFVDFGLFEVLVGIGLAAAARTLYARRIIGAGVLLASVVTAAGLVVVVPGGAVKWLAAVNLGTVLLNATIVLGAMRAGEVPRLLDRLWEHGNSWKRPP